MIDGVLDSGDRFLPCVARPVRYGISMRVPMCSSYSGPHYRTRRVYRYLPDW
ncbi:hypothetical protein I545_5257 [Mycobacterium kansasii 662]|uniref:Uncharacterized protein n=2 Tax=Mycobacterium kansasii TaxID=1768 RepID=A0A1V3WFR4_MYCKA|nr:hypothetical protein I545_5257 [Mycobacterium kansasii 662]OOK65790.1 hypothetical protein BZL30_8731 [Mycobacterium kansasii]